jgi:hypothetical protein
MQAQNVGLYEPSDDNDKIVIDVLQQVIKLGNHLAKIPKVSSFLFCSMGAMSLVMSDDEDNEYTK